MYNNAVRLMAGLGMDRSYSDFRQHLKSAIDWCTSHHEPTFITSRNERKAVLLAYEDYCALEETAYLMRSPANAARLLEAVTDVARDQNIKKRGLLDDQA